MATAPLGRAAVVTNGQSQFRFTQFVDPRNALGHSTNATTDAQRSPAPCISDVEQMAQAPRPSSGQNQDRTPSAAPSRNTPLDHNPTNSPAGLGALELVELTSNPIVEGILGPNKDGRVRNPVPSKLKGKTDNKQGNFAVMHMGLAMSPGKKNEGQGKEAAAERDAAARRTSENTASRAKAAQSEKYVPPKKRGLEASLEGPSSRGSPFSRDDHKQRGRPLAPDETKVEQARLLTLLRSINPVTVVDQICKAVAYFGGIPGAPPPEDGIFPESANTRETGALFIGWLAEIFPDVSARSPEIPRDAGPASGKKKGKQVKGKTEPDASNEPPNSRNGYGYGPAVSAPAWGLPPSLGLVNTPQITPIPLPEPKVFPNAGQSKQSEQLNPSTPVTAKQQSEENTDGNTSTSKRRRGRPKGSTNKNKGRGEGGGAEGSSSNAQHEGMQVQQGSESPQAQAAVSKPARTNTAAPPSAPPTFTPVANNQPTTSKPLQVLQYPEQSWASSFSQNQTTNSSNLPQVDELSPEERAVVEAFRHHGPEASVVPSPVTTSKPPPETGQKRKRAPPKPKPTATSRPAFQPESSQPVQNMGNKNMGSQSMGTPSMGNQGRGNQNVGNHNMGNLGNVPVTNESAMTMAKEGLQWAAVDTAAQVPPPAKRPRQRKPKAPATNDPPSRTQTASVASAATPPIPPSTIPDSQATASQQSIPPSRPPAEGLEAHYERFASLQQQQNGRSTPPVSQQQGRQQPKPPSVPPQQPSPQIQQHQMQHQKSQQSHQAAQQNIRQNVQQNAQQNVQQSVQQAAQPSVQREEPKLTQATSRPSSTTFYNQRSQASNSYSQQYPSHQPSQLYGTHQASPQMSNNSYRSSSTLAQASPQFSQAENTYRTASPHTISQPSPSFSQPDTTFRNTNTHNITQPTPSYSQAENPYRTASTHSMAQPSPSYTTSRSHSQTQPSHQNHYSHFSDSSYIDLPTLESLGHAGSSSNQNVGLSAGGYGQGMGVGLGASRSSASSNTLYGSSSGLNSAFDTGTNDLLRGVSRSGAHANSAYGTTSSGLSNAFDTGSSEDQLRERLLRGMQRR
ncbi:uncharacterized protein PAC_20045 [Phialocephala subalpina]|uniref:Uncharacterized protein n=1 Tax=Phialocephala subalpina TaxID=576137 RepID=A0A1L7XYQ3_9HELO|nr:uncharacterized protein PAC_20045 [Phialocephala subalpina]